MPKKISAPAHAKRSRKNLSLPDTAIENIQSIRALTDATTDTEVIKRALKLYKLAVENEKLGVKVILRDREGHDSILIL